MSASHQQAGQSSANETPGASGATRDEKSGEGIRWKAMLGRRKSRKGEPSSQNSMSDLEMQADKRPAKWGLGILNDRETDEVPGSILLLSKVSEYNEPLGLRIAPARTSASSLPSPYRTPSRKSSFSRRPPVVPEKKKTADGKIILEPQPDESPNDPLNWKIWRRDLALLSLGFYCMVGGGITPILAAGFNEVADDFDVTIPQVALTTGLYMMGLGLGSAILSPTAILYGKRPVYLCAAIGFIATSVWCAESPSFGSLVVARIFQGLAVSSVECLPSATVAEIYFLHEKAYRLGIYTLLLLGGKNLVPLVSAAIMQSLHWRWVFRIVAIIVAFGFCLLFVFVPETFWDRTPIPHKQIRRFPSLSLFRTASIRSVSLRRNSIAEPVDETEDSASTEKRHAHFEESNNNGTDHQNQAKDNADGEDAVVIAPDAVHDYQMTEESKSPNADFEHEGTPKELPRPTIPPTAHTNVSGDPDQVEEDSYPFPITNVPSSPALSRIPTAQDHETSNAKPTNPYTEARKVQPPNTFAQQLRPWNGRISSDSWFRVAVRPFILFCYPSILWSTLVYSLSIGWLIVLSESVSSIYMERDTYNFTPLQTGLVYISPFLGGVLGTAVAGKVSDIIVRYMARKNDGVYEPEFRLVMAIPIAISTVIGLMGYGWSAQERDAWIVPTVFFGIISFGCSLGSTTAITFAVDSYRQYAGEALVTLNFSKNIFHGLVFSLFFNYWLEGEGSKDTFVAIGGIQLACLLTTIPMYIYGKRARMWTVRRNMMERW